MTPRQFNETTTINSVNFGGNNTWGWFNRNPYNGWNAMSQIM